MYLDSNNISFLESEIFDSIQKLIYLSLASNQIKVIQSYLFFMSLKTSHQNFVFLKRRHSAPTFRRRFGGMAQCDNQKYLSLKSDSSEKYDY